MLNELSNSFLRKDIFELGIKDEIKFYNLLSLLAGQIGGQLNQNEHILIISCLASLLILITLTLGY